MQNGKPKVETLHRLVGYTQCKHTHHKNDFHHIDGNKSNNKASNILPVWKWQHNELHAILKAGMLLKDLNPEDKERYNQMVKEIKAENKKKLEKDAQLAFDAKKQLYKIPHLDFESDDKYNYFMYITLDGYRAYKATNDVPFNCIKQETAELRNQQLN